MHELTSQQLSELQRFGVPMVEFANAHRARYWIEDDEGRITVEHQNEWKQQTRLVLQLPESGEYGWVLMVETLTPWDEIEVGLFQPDDIPDRFTEALERSWTWAQEHLESYWRESERSTDELLAVVRSPGDASDTFRSWRRKEAIRALTQMGEVRAVELLIAALQDADPTVVETAAGALGDLGDERALEPLKALLVPENKTGSWGNAQDAVCKIRNRIGMPRSGWPARKSP